MLSLSKKGEYGIEVLIILSKLGEGEMISIREIAETANLPKYFLSQIMSDLKKRCYVNSKEGINGGYYLVKDIREITLFDIISVFEKDLLIVDCLCSKGGGCNRYDSCNSRHGWKAINNEIVKLFKSKTLFDLINSK